MASRFRHMRRTTLVMLLCAAILAGLVFARLNTFPFSGLVFVVLAPLIILRKNKSLIFGLFLVGLFFCLGWWRGSTYTEKLYELKQLSGQKVTLVATAEDDSVYNDKSQMTFDASEIILTEPYEAELSGKFKISGFGEPMIYRGDIVSVEGKLFPTRGSRQASINYAQIEIIASSESWLDEQRRKFSAGLASVVPEPAASLGSGLLIGQRSGLPDEVLAAMTAVGLVHIVAVSGYNLTVLTRAVQRMRLKSAYQKLIISLLLIGTFILVTGFSASIVRAAFVSVLGLLAWYYGRKIKPLILILFPAAVTAFVNPFYIWSDIGWYLSFTAFFGVLVLAPLIAKRLFSSEPKMMPMIVIETLSAQLLTLPIILAIFGRFSPVSFITNILVVPIVPFAMLAAALAAIVGVLAVPYLAMLAWPAILLLTYILDISLLFSKFSVGSLSSYISWLDLGFLYLVIISVTYLIWQKTKNKKTTRLDG